MKQRTIKDPVTIEGIGLQTGAKVSVVLKSSPADSGINFIRTDLPNKPLLNLQSVVLDPSASPERRTTLNLGPMQIQTTEHLLAALWALSLDNIVIELNSVELPGLDGSAKGYFESIARGGIVEQAAERKVFKVEAPLWCRNEDSLLAVIPDDKFRISYTMSYGNESLGTQFFGSVLDANVFREEIAPARTFCLEEEAELLIKRGFGKGANYQNTLVMGKNGPVNNVLKFRDEPVRHKVLDLVGDLYLLGLPIIGHVIAVKSGHKLNMELVSRLKGLIK